MTLEKPMSRTGNILISIFALIVFLCILEAILRIAFHRSMDFDIEMWKYAIELKQNSSNPLIGHVHAPGRSAHLMGVDVQINSNGLRDVEYPHDKPADTVRILMLGDSLTFGWGVKVEDTPSEMLEQSLNKNSRGRRYEVINTGVGNYNTEMEVNFFFDEGIKYDPDIVILNYFINDAELRSQRKMNFFLGWSYAYVYLSGRIDVLMRQFFNRSDWSRYYSDLYSGEASGWHIAATNIRQLKEFCDRRGIRMLLANYPEIRDFTNYKFMDIHRQLSRLAEDAQIAFVDLLPWVKDLDENTLWVTRADPHPNRKANRAFSSGIAAGLLQHFPEYFKK